LLKTNLYWIFLFSTVSFAATESNVMYPTQKSSIKNTLKGSMQRSHWSLIVPSFVVHGFTPGRDASIEMPRRLDKNGNSVMTPGLGIKYEGADGSLFVVGMVKDCYDNLAGTIQYGLYSKLSRDSSWGASFGFYIRETPIFCETMNSGGFETQECFGLDEYKLKFQSSLNGYPIDIIPMPFLHFSTALYKDSDLEINFKLMTNFLLNEFAISVPF
jgi:hypothetical protein